MAHETLAELAELAPLQGLEPEEQRRLAEHLDAGCAACAERYAEGVRALDVLAEAAPEIAPSPERREALLTATQGAAARPRSGPRVPGWRRGGWRVALPALAAGVALAVAVGSLYTTLRVEDAAQRAIAEARAQLAAQRAEGDRRLEALSARLARFEGALESRALGVRELPLDGTAGTLSASARVVVDPEGNQVLILASRLPPAPPGHTYQLWVIESGAPRSVGIFEPDEGGRVLHMEAAPGDLAREFSVAVSVEPAGGVPQPTGPIVLASH